MIKKKRHYISAIADILPTCTRQNIALRGHRKRDESLNRGKFLEIVSLVSMFDPVVANRLQRGPQNALYMPHNSFINIMASLVRKQICTSVERTGYFSLLVDETKDLSKDEQMSICIHPDNSKIDEPFLNFVVIPNLTAEYLSQYIVCTLALFNLNLSSIVSLGYDGASVMSGSVSGVQSHIRELVPDATYIHCHAHCSTC